MNEGRNLYAPEDAPGLRERSLQIVFLSHRRTDKPIARAIARFLSAADVHYWLDEEDRDVQHAAALGMLGDQSLVHAIERGVRHATALLGILSSRTVGSWWVPYEIGFSRSAGLPSSFIMQNIPGETLQLPEYTTVSSVYWSVDELARWASTLTGCNLHSRLDFIRATSAAELSRYLPVDPPSPDIFKLCENALTAIALLSNSECQSALALSSMIFDWLPTQGGPIREIAYDLLAPLALHRIAAPMPLETKKLLARAYSVPAEHYKISRQRPVIQYAPEINGWRHRRYQEPSTTWLQGLSLEQLDQRLDLFLTTRTGSGGIRLATKAEFKAEFDRVLASADTSSRRSLGVLINPLFGYAPEVRPVFSRVLAIWYRIYSAILGRVATPFDEGLDRLARNYLAPLC
jgi:TIR domain